MRKYLLIILLGACALSAQVYTPPQDYVVESFQYSFDRQTVYMSAHESWRGCYNLYSSSLQNGRWQRPVLISSLSTNHNELSPLITSDEQGIYFVRQEPKLDDKGREKGVKNTLYYAERLNDDWGKAEPIIVSTGDELTPLLLRDGKTLFFASKRPIDGVEQKMYSIFYTKRVSRYNYYIPVLIAQPQVEKGENYFLEQFDSLPRLLDNSLTIKRQIIQKKDTFNEILQYPLSSEFLPEKVMIVAGKVTDEETGKTISASVKVFDAVTSKLLSQSHSNQETGEYKVALLQGQKYNIDITKDNYSHAYLSFDCTSMSEDQSVRKDVQLSRNLHIKLNVFDAELLSPLVPSKIQLLDLSQKKIVQGNIPQNKTVDIKMPIGAEYQVKIQANAHEDKQIDIDTRKPVLLTHSELDVLLQPGKADVQISLQDAETKQLLKVDTLKVKNCNREENLALVADANSKYISSLRQEDSYRISADLSGYLYKDTLVKIPATKQMQTIVLQLTPLRRDAVVRLNNINFELNSYELTEESYAELNRVVELLQQNPTLKIEISAHTDDQGTDAFNMRLSDKRGWAARKYLIKRGISAERISSKGYGKRQPLVPNDSEENRAKNRRVEFKIMDI